MRSSSRYKTDIMERVLSQCGSGELVTLALVDYISAAREIEKMVIKLDSIYPVQFKLRAAQDTFIMMEGGFQLVMSTTNPQTEVFHSVLEKVQVNTPVSWCSQMVITAKHDRAIKDMMQFLQETLNKDKNSALFRIYQEFETWDIWPGEKYINFTTRFSAKWQKKSDLDISDM